MQEKWNQFVYDLIESKAKNIEEDPYHALIENQMQLLGWAKYRKEILHKLNVTTGRTFIQPDILIEKDGEVQFVIEVKRPVYTQTAKDIKQLVSYIRQLKKEVGIYIGEHIEIFYDKPGEKDAISVMTIPLELDNKRGARFVDLFSREKFNEKSIVDFCEECIEEKHRQESLNKIKDSLLSDAQIQITEALKPYLVEKYNGTFTEDEIQEMLSTIHFYASTDNLEPQKAESKPIISIPPADDTINDSPKRVFDHTEYSINGVDFYKKNGFVQVLVKEYVRLHPEKTYAELERVFPGELQGSFGVIQTLDYIRSKNYNGRRYFTEDNNVLQSSDGITFAVSTQWGKGNIPRIIKLAKELGFNVVSSEEKPSLPHKKEFLSKTEIKHHDQIHCKLTRGGIEANGIFHLNDKSLILLKGSRINLSHSPSFTGKDLEKRNKQLAQYTEERNGSLYVKEDVLFETPSGAALFCIGSSSNGWRDWKDENDNMLMVYRDELG